MKIVGAFGLALIFAAGVLAQNQTGFVRGYGSRGFGSAVLPGGTSAMPGVQRFTPSVVNPGGGGPRIAIPGATTNGNFGGSGFWGGSFTGQNLFGFQNNGNGFKNGFNNGFNNKGGFGRNGNRGTTVVTVPYAYPVGVGGGYGDPSMYGAYGNGYAAPPADGTAGPPPQQSGPSVIIVMPQQGGPMVMGPQGQGPQQPGVYQGPPGAEPEQPAEEEQTPLNEPPHYLIALKDHTIYSAIAYWVEGDTLHYFTSGNTHNQVSLSLVDKPLTTRLNKESGIDLKLPQ